MAQPDSHVVVGVLGAGAMGSGIAQVAATAGHHVLLRDVNEAAAEKGIESVRKSLSGRVAKQKLTQEGADEILGRIANGSTNGALLSECGLVIEAIVEDLAVKKSTFREIETTVSPDCILATNTSSLSVTAIADACTTPGRVIGIHFFNPPVVLPLVEIVPGERTSADVTKRARALIDSWGKTTVLASDTPGFIVNRIARPFYGEAIRIYEEGLADPATIDWAMKEFGGFRMGPFELMDFIGNDINLAATTAVYEGTNRDPRYKPSLTQQRLVEAGKLGKKSGHGHYDYTSGAQNPEPARNEALGKRIADRIIAMLVNEAADAAALGIGTPADIDLAMTKGVNYPNGLLQWGNEIGLDKVANAIETLRAESGNDDRYRVSLLLKEMSAQGKSFHQ